MASIVLLPGMDGSGTLFAEFVSALGLKTQIVAYPRTEPLGYEELELFVARRLPADEPFLLLGESFSGPVAIRVASQRPANLAAVVLVCTFARIADKRAPPFVHALFALLPFWRLPVPLGAARLFGSFNSPAVQARLAAAIRGVTPAVWRKRMRSVLDVDVTPHLQRIAVPVLYFKASGDRVVPAAAAELVARSNGLAEVVTLDGPHALLQTRPEACAAALREFARRAGIAL